MDKFKENKEFHLWWAKEGYSYDPESDEETNWLVTIQYWAWKAWEERASKE